MTTKQYNALEHVLNQLFYLQNQILNQSCLAGSSPGFVLQHSKKALNNNFHSVPSVPSPKNKNYQNGNRPPGVAVPSVPPPPLKNKNYQCVNRPPGVAVPSVPPPPPPPPLKKTPLSNNSKKKQVLTAPTPPPAPPAPGIIRRVAKKAVPTVRGGLNGIDFENLKRRSRNKRVRQVETFLANNANVKRLLNSYPAGTVNMNNLKQRLVDDRNGLNVSDVKYVLDYKNTLSKLRTNERLKNKPEPYLMNDLRKYLPTNPQNGKNACTKDDINDALDSLQIERTLIRLGGSELKKGEIAPLVKILKRKKTRNFTTNDVSNALAQL